MTSDRSRVAPDRGVGAFVPAVVLMLSSLVVLIVAATAPPTDGRPVAAVFGPGLTLAETIARVGPTGATIVRTGGLDNIVIVQSDDPALVQHLRAAGAWLIVDPRAVAACLRVGET